MYRPRIAVAIVMTAAVAGALATASPALAADVTIQGRTVAASTGTPVAGVRVTAVDVLDGDRPVRLSSIGVSDRRGYWRVSLPGRFANLEGLGLHFNGSAAGREKGFGGCRRNVVATWDDACSFGDGAGRIWAAGRFRLDPA